MNKGLLAIQCAPVGVWRSTHARISGWRRRGDPENGNARKVDNEVSDDAHSTFGSSVKFTAGALACERFWR
jgi:hypothetical protein